MKMKEDLTKLKYNIILIQKAHNSKMAMLHKPDPHVWFNLSNILRDFTEETDKLIFKIIWPGKIT